MDVELLNNITAMNKKITEQQAEIDRLNDMSREDYWKRNHEEALKLIVRQQVEMCELVDMLEELRKLQKHDAMYSPDELTRIDALIKKHKGE